MDLRTASPSNILTDENRANHEFDEADKDAGDFTSRCRCSARLFTAILGLRTLLMCRLCSKLLEDTYTVSECGHQFCRLCIYDYVGKRTKCPTCSLPARVGRLVKNPKSDVLVACLKKLLRLYGGMFMEGSGHEASQRSSRRLSVSRSCSPPRRSPLPTLAVTSGQPSPLVHNHTSQLVAADALVPPLAEAPKVLSHVTRSPSGGRYSSAPLTETLDRVVVIVLTGVHGDHKRIIEEAADDQYSRRCGIRFTIHTGDSSNDCVTHVVAGVSEKDAPRQLCGRTLKYMYGVVQGLWIVRPEWLLDSLKASTWLSEEIYEIEGDMVFKAKTEGPKKGRLRKHGFAPPLFEHCRFYLYGDFGPPNIGGDDLRKLLVLSGATLLHRRPPLKAVRLTNVPIPGKQTPLDTTQPIVVIDPTRCNPREGGRSTAWLAKYQVVSSVWVLDCISAGEALLDQSGV